MSQNPPTPPSSATGQSGAPAQDGNSTPPLDEQIAAKEEELKLAQHELDTLIAEDQATTAFKDENDTLKEALETAIEKIPDLKEAAAGVIVKEEEVKQDLSPEKIAAIECAVDEVYSTTGSLQEAAGTSVADSLVAAGTQVTAQATHQNARAATSQAKRLLGEHTRLIDSRAARITSLISDAGTAMSQSQPEIAYLLIQDLKEAVDEIETLASESETAPLIDDIDATWLAEKDALKAEREATWSATQAQAALQDAQTNLTDYEATRRQTLDDLAEPGKCPPGQGSDANRTNREGTPQGQQPQDRTTTSQEASAAATELADGNGDGRSSDMSEGMNEGI